MAADPALNVPDTPPEAVTAAIDRVASKAPEWAALPVAEKLALFKHVRENLEVEQHNLCQASCTARGYNFQDEQNHGHLIKETYSTAVLAGAAWISGGIKLLEQLLQTGHAQQGLAFTQRPDGTTRITVAPSDLKEKLLDVGEFQVVVRGEPRQFSPLEAPACVTGTLGAGNTDICNDIVDPLVKQNSVVIYKVNPVMALGAQVKERIFKPLIDRGYLAFVYGGVDPGKQIVDSPLVDRIFITGSCHTFDKIVWSGRDKADPSINPAVTKPVLAELGSVNPYIVVPGNAKWSDKDIDEKAEGLVAYKMQNSGHICAAPQVVVTCRQWPQREQFLQAVSRKCAACPAYPAFYPSVASIYKNHKANEIGGMVACEQTEKAFGERQLTPLFRTDAWKPEDGDAPSKTLGLRDEAFSPVLYEVAIDTEPTLPNFLPAAVDFVHKRCWGSLTCTVVVDDATQKRHLEALDTALDSMQFGAIGVNFNPSAANAFPVLPWGAFPRHTNRDVQSGLGHIGNLGCWENIEKCIMKHKFKNPHAFTFPDASRPVEAMRGRRLSSFFIEPSLFRMVKVAAALYGKI